MKRTVFTVLLLTGCLEARDTTPVEDARACTSCHGDLARDAGSIAEKAAPPIDAHGNTDVSYPGVGAHALHLSSSPTHAAFPCETCHRVPKTPRDEGHNVGQTTFAFSALATGDGGVARYDFDTRRCSNACHLEASPVWTRANPNACGTCHGLPPAAPHPQSTACHACHADVIDADGGIVNPALHVNGTVDVVEASCLSCHGSDAGAAPPRALDGSEAIGALGVGAHQKHLLGGANTRPVPCETCHDVPARAATANHPNGGPAEVKAALQWNREAATCTTACHGGTSPRWNDANASLTCAGCHGAPPALPHPKVTNCGLCHAGVSGQTFVDRSQHVNGTINASMPTACDGCHGSSTNFAPPRDTNGATATTLVSVGAHQTHVEPTGRARVVQCEECHVVPATVLAPGHVDGRVLVRFQGVALANLAQPAWNGTTCTNSACHDVSNYTASAVGTIVAPTWTRVDGSQNACGTCHGVPPALPHVQRNDCENCHTNVTAQKTFRHPERHIDGTVDFVVP